MSGDKDEEPRQLCLPAANAATFFVLLVRSMPGMAAGELFFCAGGLAA